MLSSKSSTTPQQPSHHHHQHPTSWSSQSASPSPPPPPLPPPVAARWSRNEVLNGGAMGPPPGGGGGGGIDHHHQHVSSVGGPPPPIIPCAHCRGRIASIPTRTTSLSSYSGYKDRTATPTPISRPHEDEDSFPVLCDRELHSLHRNVPALRRRDVDTATIKQHYYPEGGWGWLVCGAAFLAHLLTSGLQLSFGLLYVYVMKFLVKKHQDKEFYVVATAWMGALCLCTSFFVAPLIVAVCRRKSTRLASFLGGLMLALACLFTSFAMQFHQAVLSYGVVLGAGAGIVRETSSLMLGHYFKKRREFVEMVAQSGTGVGMALFSVLYKEAVGKLGWRLGLQAITGLLALAFFLPIIYRSANLYHPQRRAITHLKNQRKKVKEKKTHVKVKKPPMFDFTPLKSRGLRVLLVASASGALGIYAPIFYLSYQGFKEEIEDSALVLLQTFLGFASALGCVGFGLVTVRPSSQCLISRQYLCQTAMVGIGVSLLALRAVQGYHGYVLFVWLYGICLGGYNYSLKMFTLERIRARHFTKAWSFVLGATALPVLIGVPITGYINQSYPKAGYYFSFLATVLGASLMFLVGTKKDPITNGATNNVNNGTNGLVVNGGINHYSTPALQDQCACPIITYSTIYPPNTDPLAQYNNSGLYRTNSHGPHHYEPHHRAATTSSSTYYDSLHRPNHRHLAGSNRQLTNSSRYLAGGSTGRLLPKSLSYAANIERVTAAVPPQVVRYLNYNNDFARYNHQVYGGSGGYSRGAPGNYLRPSKSVPEGLARTEYYCGSYNRRPVVRNVQVIEQITTSV